MATKPKKRRRPHGRSARPKRRTSRARSKTTERQRQDEAMRRVVHAVRLMRVDKLSLTKAARRAHTTSATARKYGGATIRDVEGRYQVAPTDTLPRMIRFLTATGTIALPVSRPTASRIAQHANAVRRYLRTGDLGPLRAFKGRAVRVGKITFPFLTDPRTLDRLAHAGEVEFEDLYAELR